MAGIHRTKKILKLNSANFDLFDFFFKAMIWSSGLLVGLVFFWIIGDLLWNGISGISIDFLLKMPENSGRSGGIFSVLVSTILVLAVCLVVSIPVGLGTAILLGEFSRKNGLYSRLVRRFLDILAGIPSIVFGLFGNAFFSSYLGLGFSILSGGLTLSCMVLPIFIRTVETGFHLVPDDYRKAAAGLGISRPAILWRVLLPAAAPQIMAGLILGIGRALAETAALIFTSGYVDRMPDSLFDSGRALSVHIFDLAMNVPGGTANSASSALVLIFLLLVLNFLTFYLGDKFLSRRITR
jgi:phosphate transport system permease protein